MVDRRPQKPLDSAPAPSLAPMAMTDSPTSAATHPALVFKIHPADDWARAEQAGRFDGAPVDHKDGFIHFSTGAQARETAAKHFAGQDGLLLIAVRATDLGDALRWEPSRGGQLFPHLYAALPMAAVRWVQPLPRGADGGHRFPEDVR
jgi:uncharacterized protein (DUF952 family)